MWFSRKTMKESGTWVLSPFLPLNDSMHFDLGAWPSTLYFLTSLLNGQSCLRVSCGKGSHVPSALLAPCRPLVPNPPLNLSVMAKALRWKGPRGKAQRPQPGCHHAWVQWWPLVCLLLFCGALSWVPIHGLCTAPTGHWTSQKRPAACGQVGVEIPQSSC